MAFNEALLELGDFDDDVRTEAVADLGAEADRELVIGRLSSNENRAATRVGDAGREEQPQRTAAQNSHRLLCRNAGGLHSAQRAGEQADECSDVG